MELETLKGLLLEMVGVTEEIPFGPEALVYKVMGKMFALVAWDESPMRISLKCDPERAVDLCLKASAAPTTSTNATGIWSISTVQCRSPRSSR